MLVALGAVALGGGLTACVGKPGSGPTTGAGAPVDAVTAAPAVAKVAEVAPASASVRGGTAITVSGAGLAGVTAARIGEVETPVTSASARRVVFPAPGSPDFASGTVEVVLVAGTETVATTRVRYAPVDGVDRQLQYVLTYWKDYNPEYQRLGTTDCVDFLSQSLLARGWKQQGSWTHAEQVETSGGAWISSTMFRDFMTAHPELGSPLTDDERSKVRLGDVVQFDWDGTGDRDHTGVVTRITTEGGRTRIGFAGHTLDSDYRDVDEAITKDHPGGAAYYWSLA